MKTWGKFLAADPQILWAKLHGLFTRDLYTPGLRLCDVEMVDCCSVSRNAHVRNRRSMDESGEPLLTVPVHVIATCSMFWVYTWRSRHYKVTARRSVETSDAADTMTHLHMEEKKKKKKKKIGAQQICPAVQLVHLRQTVRFWGRYSYSSWGKLGEYS